MIGKDRRIRRSVLYTAYLIRWKMWIGPISTQILTGTFLARVSNPVQVARAERRKHMAQKSTSVGETHNELRRFTIMSWFLRANALVKNASVAVWRLAMSTPFAGVAGLLQEHPSLTIIDPTPSQQRIRKNRREVQSEAHPLFMLENRKLIFRSGCLMSRTIKQASSAQHSLTDHCLLLTLSIPRVINLKFPLQPHQKYYITQ